MPNVTQLQQENETLKQQVGHLSGYVTQLEEALIMMRQNRFGPSSEKNQGQGQQQLIFNEAEATLAEEMDEDDEEQIDESTSLESSESTPDQADPIETTQTRKRSGRKPLPDSLPRKLIIHDLPESEKVCAIHGTALQPAGDKTNEQLNIIPATIEVLRHVRKQYSCPCCEGGMRIATKPIDPIPKSQASAATLATICAYKYLDGLPLYRQVAMLKRIEIEFNRGTMAEWMIKCGLLIQPLINLLRDSLLAEPLIHLDETTVQVLRESGKPAQSSSYMWVQASYFGSERPVVLFDYDPSRSSEVPKALLQDYQGAIMVDGYEGYNRACVDGKIIRLGCMTHARRKFVEARKVAGKNGKSVKENYAIKLIGKLYKIEQEAKGFSPTERYRYRQERAVPLLDKLHEWMTKTMPTVPPKLALGKALSYLHHQWPRLIQYLVDGRYPIDNNRAENAIRPFVIGRKAWMFSTSVEGAKASANLYSLLETVKANNQNPYDYLKKVFTDLPNAKSVEDIEALLPWNIDLENQECR